MLAFSPSEGQPVSYNQEQFLGIWEFIQQSVAWVIYFQTHTFYGFPVYVDSVLCTMTRANISKGHVLLLFSKW